MRAGSRSPNGQLAARLGLSQVPRLHPRSRPRPVRVGRRGSWSPTWAFTGHRGTVLCCSTTPRLLCARLQPPSVLLTRKIWCQRPQILCLWEEAAARALARVGPEGSHRVGQSKLLGVFFIMGWRKGYRTRCPKIAFHVCSGERVGADVVFIVYSYNVEHFYHVLLFSKQIFAHSNNNINKKPRKEGKRQEFQRVKEIQY